MSIFQCGCFCLMPSIKVPFANPSYLPRCNIRAHTTIKDVTSRTILTQTFFNDSDDCLEDVVYSFPLYDGVSVVSFEATVGYYSMKSFVQESQRRHHEYDNVVNDGLSATLLSHLDGDSNVFVTNIGQVPARCRVIIEIVYIGELRYDAQLNGARFTIPSFIAPRDNATSGNIAAADNLEEHDDAIKVTVDFQNPVGYPIQHIQSPSHPINVTAGRTSDMPTDATHMPNRGSATLSIDTTTLEKDFVVVAIAKDSDRPKALLETHVTELNQRALVASLFSPINIGPSHGEIVFIVDGSSGMHNRIDMEIQAIKVLLESLPVGIVFNICSFGASDKFLWKRSRPYNDTNLKKALSHIAAIETPEGPSDMYAAVSTTISRRFREKPLDVIMLIGGDFWQQTELFEFVEEASRDYKCRFFSLGIGADPKSSIALIEGIATAGNGFSEFITRGEEMNAKLDRLLKGALSPHIDDYSLEVVYKEGSDSTVNEPTKAATEVESASLTESEYSTVTELATSLIGDKLDVNFSCDTIANSADTVKDGLAHRPTIPASSILQAPRRIPPLYPFPQTTVYLLLDPSTYHLTLEAIILHARGPQGPIKLAIEIEDIGMGETIHQLAARKAVSELEKDWGWLATPKEKADDALIQNRYASSWQDTAKREAIRLGIKYRIAGKWCSFVAVDGVNEQEAIVLGTILSTGIPKARNLCGHPVITFRMIMEAIFPRMSDLLPARLVKKWRSAAKTGAGKR